MKNRISNFAKRTISFLICIMIVFSMIPFSAFSLSNSYGANTVVKVTFKLPKTNSFTGLEATIEYGTSLSYEEDSLVMPHVDDAVINSSTDNTIQLNATNIDSEYDISSDHILCTANFTVLKDVSSLDISCSYIDAYIMDEDFNFITCDTTLSTSVEVLSQDVTVALSGDMNNWGDTVFSATTTNVYAATIQLGAGTYEFKMKEDSTWLGNGGTIQDTTETTSPGVGWEMSTSEGSNCKLVATGGIYTFTYNVLTNMLIITMTSAPAGTITATNNVAATQNVTLKLSAQSGVAGYYWGTSSSYSSNTYTSTSSTSVVKEITASGTYYLTVKDKNGYFSETQSITFYKTLLSANGGSVTPGSVLTAKGNSFTFPTPTRDGYDYVGWGTSSTATSGVKTLTPSGNKTYYAVWKSKEYTIVGYINGQDVGCEGDSNNVVTAYNFVNGTVTIDFAQDSYVFVKTTDNANWYMFKSATTATSGTLYNTSTGANEKMFVPKGKTEFTLVENSDGTLTLSYVAIDEGAPTVSISSTNNVATSQTVTLNFADDRGIAGYYWGTSSTVTSNTYTTTSSTSVTKSVTSSGTYYLAAKDTAGNISTTASITFYKTTLNANGGSVTPASVLTAKGNSFTFPTPTYSGYIFQGWGTSATATSGVTTLTPTASKTYYALWMQEDITAPTGTITSTNDVATKQTVTLKLSDNVGVAGYYWGTSATYTSNTYTETTSTSVTKTVTSSGTYYLTVKDTSGNVSTTVSLAFYKTTLNANGGTVTPTSVLTAKGNSFTFPTPTNGTYDCVGWNTSATATSGVTTLAPTASKTYYAIWKAKVYTIVGSINGSDVGCEGDSNTVVEAYNFVNGTVTIDFEKDSYVFIKSTDNRDWYMFDSYIETATSGTLKNTSTGANEKMKVPAGKVKFTLADNGNDTFTLSYVVIDETKPTGKITSTNNVATSQTATLTLSDDRGVAGYWWGTNATYTNNTYTDTTSASVTKTISTAGTYYLTVKDTSGNVSTTVSQAFYKTTLNANGGSVTPASVITAKGNKFTMPKATRSGYIFQGWGTSASATTGILELTPSGNTTYYALWVEEDKTAPTGTITSTNDVANKQTVTLKLSDNVGVASYYWGTSSTPTDYTATTSTSVTKTVSSAGTYYLSVKDTSGNVSTTASLSFYKTTLNANGGTVTPTSVITAKGNSFTFPTPTNGTYDCLGWATTSTATSGVSTLTPSSNATYYAVWKAKAYTIVGFINGANVGCEGDHENVVEAYNFTDGTVTIDFAEESHVFIKSTDNRDWYMFDSYVQTTSGTLKNTSTGANEKMKVPAGKVKFTLKDNGNDTFTLSYVVLDTTKPSGTISSTNNVATSQTVTLALSDDRGVAGYWWGTNATYTNNTYTETTSASVTKTISASGTYYLTVKDTSGNVSETKSITFYKTTLNGNNGTVSPTSVITAKGNGFTMPTPTRSGYIYQGWGTSATASSGIKELTPTKDATYYALWVEEDKTAPTGTITSTNDVADKQTVTLKLSDNVGVAGYWWGTNSTYTSNTYTDTTSASVTKTVSNSGTYYLTVKDTSGNVSTTVSQVFYKTTLNANGGSVTPATVITAKGNKFTMPTAEKGTYDFLGWGTSATATSGIKELTPSANGTYYAIWKEKVYTIVGSINGSDVGCEGDSNNVVTAYNFVDGTVTIDFTSESYVFIKSTDNRDWYMFDSYVQTTSGTLKNTSTGVNEKMKVPAGRVKFTLVDNGNDTFTLSYIVLDTTVPTGTITSTNDVAASQKVTLSMNDDRGLASYYWGTSSTPADSAYTASTATSVTKTVTDAGTYYLLVKDTSGNVSQIKSITFYKTTLNPNSGSVTPTSVLTAKGNKFAMPTPTRSGYIFQGWGTSTTATSGIKELTPTKDATYYALWVEEDKTAPTGTITSTNDVATKQTVTLKLSDNVAVEGYWWGTKATYTENTYTATSSESITKSITSAGTYYLTVKDTSGNISTTVSQTFYKTTLNANGGSVTPATVITAKGNKFTMPTPENGTYDFLGWGTSADATSGITELTPTSSKTYYAVWKPKAYTIVGFINGQMVGCEDDHENVVTAYNFVDGTVTIDFAQESHVFIKSTDNRDWYMFDSYVQTTSGTLKNTATGTTEKMKVPAGKVKFTLVNNGDDTFTLSYVVLDTTAPTGTITSTNNVATSQTVTLTLADDRGVAGYYWGTKSNYSDNEYTATTATSVTKTVSDTGTYYLTVKDTSGNISQSKSITFYKTTLNANGGSVTPASVLTEKGKSFTFPVPTRSGYIYQGWALSQTASSGAMNVTPTGSTTYFAIWLEEDKTVPTGKISSTNNVAEKQTVTLTLSDNVAVEGYWWGTNATHTSNTYTETTAASVTKTVTEAGTYYLTVKDTSGNISTTVSQTFYKTTLNANGGSVTPATVITPQGNKFAMPTPEKGTYDFLGWGESATATGGITELTPTSSKTYYAVWKAKHYTIVGHINGNNVGCEGDHENVVESYNFVNGTVTIDFTTESHVFIKSTDNRDWYMFESYVQTESGTLKNTNTGANEKMKVPAGRVKFTLVDNKDETFTLSYIVLDTTKPIGEISYTNDVATSQKVTLDISDDREVASYYWGTSASPSDSDYVASTQASITKTVSKAGTYYLSVKDTSGNFSDTKSVTFYKTTLDANGGSVTPSSVLTAKGNKFAMPTPVRSGYIFQGWGISTSASSGIKELTPTKDATYYALWVEEDKTAPIATLTTTNNVANTQTATLKMTDNVAIDGYWWGTDSTPENNPYTESSSTTVTKAITNSGTYYLTVKDTSGNVSTTASLVFYKTTLNANGGSVEPTSVITAKGNKFTMPNAEKGTYDFLGWNESATATSGITELAPTKNATYYAIWKAKVYTIVGHINGKDVGCEGDGDNVVQAYNFVNGTVTIDFTQESHVFVKSTDNRDWYMFDSYIQTETSGTLKNTNTGANEKMKVPVGKVKFTLVDNGNETFTLSYVVLDITAPSGTIATTNDVASSQKVTLSMNDDRGLASYYWGKSSSPADSDYTASTATSVTKTVSEAGTYYLSVKDTSGNVSEIKPVTFYKTTLDANQGSVTPASVITAKGNKFVMPKPTRSGYVFQGWNTSATASSGILELTPTKNDTYYAIWIEEDKTAPTGTITSTNDVAVKQTVTLKLSDNVAVEGYWWGTKATYTENTYTEATSGSVTKSITSQGTYYLTVKDTSGNISKTTSITFYKTTLNTSGGAVSPTSVLTAEGNKFTMPTPEKGTYDFLGWNESAGATSGITELAPTKNATYYAIWKAKVYTIVGSIDGKDVGCEGDSENVVEAYNFVDGTVTIVFAKESYVFVKSTDNRDWYMFDSYVQTTSGTLKNTTTGVNEKMKVPAGKVKFTLVKNDDDTFTLSYVVIDETAPIAAITSTNDVAPSQTATLSMTDNFGVAGYWWGTDANYEDNTYTATSDTSVTKKITTSGTYYLTVKDTSGNISSTAAMTYHKTTLNANGGSVTPTSVLTANGNKFTFPVPENGILDYVGWATSKDATTGTKALTPNADRTYYAIWKAKEYTIVGNINGQDIGFGDDKETVIESYNFVDGKVTIEFAKDSYVFVKTTDNVNEYMFNEYVQTTSGTLYKTSTGANEKMRVPAGKIEFTLVENSDGSLKLSYVIIDETPPTGTITSTNDVAESQTVTLGLADDMGVAGYYWGTDATYTNNKYTETSQASVTETVTDGGIYYLTVKDTSGNVSKSEAITFYRTTLNANGGNVSLSKVVTASGNSFTFPVPTRNGYIYQGWGTTSSAATGVTSLKPTKNSTYYAVWLEEDKTAPTGTITTTNEVATSQTVTLGLADNAGVEGYWWGTDATYTNNTYTATADTSVTKKVSDAGTYYLTVKDTSGNISETISITFFKTTLNANGGSVTPEYVLTAKNNTFKFPTPEKGTYEYLGWSTSANDTAGVKELTVTKNSTYYAVWKAKVYTIVGFIDGANVGCEGDSNNVVEAYNFVDGTVTINFAQESHVFIKSTDNRDWYMFESYVESTSGTMYNTTTGAHEKMKVPAGKVKFTLVNNGDDTFALSYVVIDETAPTGTITSTNDVASSQTVTLDIADDRGVAGYYWGTNASHESNTFTTATAGKITKKIDAEGTYYLTVKDTSGNISTTKSITFYKTTLNANGGSVTPSTVITEKGKTITLPTPTNGHMEYKGWGTTQTATSGVKELTVSKNASYYAVWAKREYTVVGNINGKDVGFDTDSNTVVQAYNFVDGAVTIDFTEASYIFVKTTDNANWYMFKAYTEKTSDTLYSTTTGATEKMYVPAGKIKLNIEENADGTLTLSYEVIDTTPPTGSITSTNDVATSQTVTLNFEDNEGIAGYYWGTNASYDKNTYTATSKTSATVKVSESGTYYLTVKDTNSNVSETKSITFYKTTLDANGGSVTLAYVITAQGNTFRFPVPTYDDYNYNGWATSKDSKTGVAELKPTTDSTYYAIWGSNEYTIVGHINGVNVGCEENASQVVEAYNFVGDSVTITFESESHVFIKSTDNYSWYMFETYEQSTSGTLYNTSTGAHEKMKVPAGKVTFTLKDNGNDTFTLSYYVHDTTKPEGTITSTNDVSPSQTVTLGLTDNVGVAGYWWGTKSAYAENVYTETTEASVTKTVTEAGTYYLTVKDKNGNISDTKSITFHKTTLNANGGNVSPTTIITAKGNKITLPTASKGAYPFMGWSTSQTATSGVKEVSVSSDSTYYAVWGERQFTIVGNIDGKDVGFGDDENTVVEAYNFVDGKVTITFSKESYVFVKTTNNIEKYMFQSYVQETSGTLYNTTTGANEKMYVPAGKITFTLKENNDNTLTLSYIVIDETKPTASIISTNDVAESQTVTLELSDNVGVAGYWWGTDATYTKNTYTETSDTSISKAVTSAGTYYLTVKDTSGNISETKSITFYKTTLDGNGANVTPSSVLTAKGNKFTFPSVSLSGHKFNGWATSKDEPSGVTELTPTSNATYYAIWSIQQYTVVGNINGNDIGFDNDASTVVPEYNFVDGKVTIKFEKDSYIFIKSTDNRDWYMFNAYTEKTSDTLYSTTTGAKEKMKVPAGTVTLTLVNNGNDTFTLSYVVQDTTKPTGTITSTNDVADNQTVTLKLEDNKAVAGYWWGTNASYESNSYTATTDSSVTKKITESGTYYLTVKDADGNISETTSVTFYKTTLNGNGGSVTPTAVLTAKGNKFTFPTPTNGNMTYNGWATSKDATTGVTELAPTSDATYYAIWTAKEYTIVGNINGKNVGCDDDYLTVVPEYTFVDGKVTINFETVSHIFVKTTDNANWYMFKSYVETESTGTLYNTSTGANEKMKVPQGEVELNLVENADGTLTLSYSVKEEPTTETTVPTPDVYTVAGSAGLCGTEWNENDINNDMTNNGDGTYTKVYNDVSAGEYEFKIVTNHDWSNPNYGDGSENVKFTVENEGATVTINFDSATGKITYTVEGGETKPSETEPSDTEPSDTTPSQPVSDVYTVAGSAGLCGTEWNEKDTNNDMTANDDGTYTKVYSGITAGEYEFKIVTNHDWSNPNYGDNGGNVKVTVNSTATVTINFNPSTGAITYIVKEDVEDTDPTEPPSSEPIINTYTVTGSWVLCGTDWDPTDVNNDMISNGDGTYTKVYTDVVAGDYAFKVVVNHNWESGWYGDNGEDVRFTVGNTATVTINFDSNTGIITYFVEETPTESESTEPAPEEKTVYLVNSAKWNNVYILAWGVGNNGEWPGVAMNKTTQTDANGYEVYSYTYTEEFTEGMFNNGAEAGTETVTLVNGKYYNLADNKWYDRVEDIPVEEYTIIYKYNTYDGIGTAKGTLTKNTYTVKAKGTADVTTLVNKHIPVLSNPYFDYNISGSPVVSGTKVTVTLAEKARQYTVIIDGKEYTAEYMERITVDYSSLKAFAIDGKVISVTDSFTFIVTGDTDITVSNATSSTTVTDGASLSLVGLRADVSNVYMELLASASVDSFSRMGVAFATSSKSASQLKTAINSIASGTSSHSNGVVVHNSSLSDANVSGQYQFTYAPYLSKDSSAVTSNKTLYFYAYAVKADGTVIISDVVAVNPSDALK